MRMSSLQFRGTLLFGFILICAGCSSAVNLDESVTDGVDSNSESSEITDASNLQLEGANNAIQFALQLMVAQNQSATGLQVNATARFYETATPLLNPPKLRAKQIPDTCEITGLGDQFTVELLDFPIDHLIEADVSEILQINRIVAGETVELRADAGSYASLLLDADLAEPQYSIPPSVELNSEPPQAMVLDVPGAQFPAGQFNWVKPDALNQDMKDQIRRLNANPILDWEGRTAAIEKTLDSSLEQESRVLFWVGQIDELTGDFAAYQCDLQDDGEFTIPAQIQQLYSDGLDPTFISVARYTRRVQVVADIALVSVYVDKF